MVGSSDASSDVIVGSEVNQGRLQGGVTIIVSVVLVTLACGCFVFGVGVVGWFWFKRGRERGRGRRRFGSNGSLDGVERVGYKVMDREEEEEDVEANARAGRVGLKC